MRYFDIKIRSNRWKMLYIHCQSYKLTQTVFRFVYFSIECKDLSDPLPDSFIPGNDTVISVPAYVFTVIIPDFIPFAILCALDKLDVQTPAAKPYEVSLAIDIASSSLEKGITDKNNQKTK